MKMIKIRFTKLKIKLKVCYNILTGKHKHWFFTYISTEDLIKMFKEQEFEVNVEYHGIKEYVFNKMLKTLGENINQSDLELQKIEFEFNAMKWRKNKNTIKIKQNER